MEKRIELKLDREIKEISKVIPNIHRGGCGVFALLLWDTLAFNGIITKPIELLDDHPNWTKNHILLNSGRLYIDSNGVHDTTDWLGFRVERPMSLERLRTDAWRAQIWFNGVNSFDRRNVLPLKQQIHKLGHTLQQEKHKMLSIF